MRDFLVSLSGAVVGALSTLLILFILNGGNLLYASKVEVGEIGAALVRVDENLGATSSNVNTLSDRIAVLEKSVPVAPVVETSTDAAAVEGPVEAAATEILASAEPTEGLVSFKAVPYRDANGNGAMDPGEEDVSVVGEVAMASGSVAYSSLDGTFQVPAGIYELQFMGARISDVEIDMSKNGTDIPVKIQ